MLNFMLTVILAQGGRIIRIYQSLIGMKLWLSGQLTPLYAPRVTQIDQEINVEDKEQVARAISSSY